MRFNNIISAILGLPKTVYFNIKYFGISGLKLPIILSNNVKIINIKGEVVINSDIKSGMVLLGFGEISIFDKKRYKSIWNNKGKIIFGDKCKLDHGFRIDVNGNGELYFGQNCNITANSSIICNKRIVFGNDLLMSWECLIMDTDYHKIYNQNNNVANDDEEIVIGNHVWICCRNTILKGSVIEDNSILGSCSRLSSKIKEQGVLISGNPAKVVKRNINWKC